MKDELSALADGKKVYAYQGRDFPVAIVRVEDSHNWNGRKIVISPKNSLYVLPPERRPDTKFYAALIFADWGKLEYRLFLRRGFLASMHLDGGSYASLDLAMQHACDLLLRSLNFGAADQQDCREIRSLFDRLPRMPEVDWDAYCETGNA